MKSLPALASTLSVLLTCAFPTSLAAAETFKLHVHGFSADGSKFTFEEYGVHDGSGIPHASLYVIDVSTDNNRPDKGWCCSRSTQPIPTKRKQPNPLFHGWLSVELFSNRRHQSLVS